ncbi:NUDIX hydrolase [Angustibacter luteus]|uniref:NUDIX hydrolase n=1 Tax=Angustibacter luteus TaxID=658456 RepID=A0ABW1JED5_9ACTN
MWEWETSVVLVRSAADELLFVRQDYGHRFFGLPGGRVEAGEEPQAAAVRELFEETGLTADTVAFLRTYDLVYPGTDSSYGAHVFVCDRYWGELATNVPDEISSVGWWSLGELPSPLTPSAHVVVRDLTRPS